jgi:hypothetical protein
MGEASFRIQALWRTNRKIGLMTLVGALLLYVSYLEESFQRYKTDDLRADNRHTQRGCILADLLVSHVDGRDVMVR